LAGLLTEFTETRSRKGNPYGKGLLEDFCGSVALLVFEGALQQFRSRLNPGCVLVIKGRVHCEAGAGLKVFVEKVEALQAGQSNDPQIHENSPALNVEEETPATDQEFSVKK
jgi:DNA polymerase III alpha subunit